MNSISDPITVESPIRLQRLSDCPAWCNGHRSIEDTFCMSDFYDWVTVDNGIDDSDTVTVTVAQHVGEAPKVCVFPGDSSERGVRMTDAEADQFISQLISARRVLDPTYTPALQATTA